MHIYVYICFIYIRFLTSLVFLLPGRQPVGDSISLQPRHQPRAHFARFAPRQSRSVARSQSGGTQPESRQRGVRHFHSQVSCLKRRVNHNGAAPGGDRPRSHAHSSRAHRRDTQCKQSDFHLRGAFYLIRRRANNLSRRDVSGLLLRRIVRLFHHLHRRRCNRDWTRHLGFGVYGDQIVFLGRTSNLSL